jgi:putative DNA methylase
MTNVGKPTRKKLIEHSLPLDAINAASSREKSVRHGHPSTLHLWWARRPLAACRAVLFGQLVDDPSAWPDRFPDKETQDRERRHLHKVIENMVEWPKSTAADQKRFETAIEAARWEIARSTAWGIGEEPPAKGDPAAVLNYLQTKAPPVYDPFCGGGSIPLEAQRLGLRAYGSDLNPVAVLITKALIEFPPKFAGLTPVHPEAKDELRHWKGAQGLAEDIRRYGRWMRHEAEKRIGQLYPKAKLADGREATAIAWLWVRTVASPDPAQKGAHVPLASSFMLSSKAGSEAIVVPVKDANAKDGWRFAAKTKDFTEVELAAAKDGTKSARGSNFVCILSGTAIASDYIKAEGKAGRMGERLMTIVAEGDRGRSYLSPNAEHEHAAEIKRPGVPELEQEMPENPRWFSPPDYGMRQYVDLFTPRQVTALTVFSGLVGEARSLVQADAKAAIALFNRADPDRPLCEGGAGPTAYADAVATYLAFAANKLATRSCTQTAWYVDRESTMAAFARQAIPMTWDFAEMNTLLQGSGSFENAVNWTAEAVANLAVGGGHGAVSNLDASRNNYPMRPIIVSTDPPYYDNIGYADLSDFFYLWLKKTLGQVHPELFRRVITPKAPELVATPYRHGGKAQAEAFFINGMSDTLKALRTAARADEPLAIYYAFKQSEAAKDGIFSPGWASFLQAVVDAGLVVDGTWPTRTEQPHGLRVIKSNSLASSVVLICRKRPGGAPATARREFLRELKPTMAEAILAHQKAGIPFPDRRQAAIGPGIGVFSKYSQVREADDSPMRVATALALINKEIDALLSQGTEDLDAETRFALEWYQMHGYSARRAGSGDAIAQLLAFNLSEDRINASGIFRARRGDAKLLTREEMHAAVLERYGKRWRPSLDDAFTVWELAQHMVLTLRAQDGGLDAAGKLLAERHDCVRDVLLLAERMFELATTRGENDEALAWNELQTSWPEIENAADRAYEGGVGRSPEQGAFGF